MLYAYFREMFFYCNIVALVPHLYNMKNLFFALFAVAFLAACSEDDITDPVVSYDSGWRRYNVSLSVRCGIFQFEDTEENSPQAKINKMLLAEFSESEAHILKTLADTVASDFPPYRGELRATSELYMCTSMLVSVKNKIYYYNNGAHGEICESGLNFKILPNGEVKRLQLSDLFDNSEDWLTPLLLESIKALKKEYGADSFWEKDSIESAIATSPDKPKYIHSFVYTGRGTLILIFNALSLMPNAAGMPTVEISTKGLPFYKGIL